MNIWKYHSKPELIKGFWYKELISEKIAFDILQNEKNTSDKLRKQLEHVIKNNGKLSYRYAVNIIKKPFPLGEPSIFANPLLKHRYVGYFLKGKTRISRGKVIYKFSDKENSITWSPVDNKITGKTLQVLWIE